MIFGGEHFGDLPTQVGLLSSLLMMAVVAALAVLWRSRPASAMDIGRTTDFFCEPDYHFQRNFQAIWFRHS